jgi:arginine deiminase
MPVNITSEYGRLREAIMHRPGRELARMTPSTRDYFLFDDLLFDEHAQEEHDWLVDILQNHLGVKVHLFENLFTEALANAGEEERQRLITQVMRLEQDMPPVEQRVGQLEVMVRWFQGQGWPQYTGDPEGEPQAAAPGSLPASLARLRSRSHAAPAASSTDGSGTNTYVHRRLTRRCDEGNFDLLAEELIEGIDLRAGALSSMQGPDDATIDGEGTDALRNFAEGRLFSLTPVPNMMFTHDIGTIIDGKLLLSRMAASGRAREPLLLDFVHRHHPLIQDVPSWTWADARVTDPSWPFAASPLLHLEGGNVVQIRDDLVVLGVNGRTSMESVQRVADSWREYAVAQDRKITLYILRLPAGFNHLDSVMGLISPTECVVYPPVFEAYGPASVDVVRAELSSSPVLPERSADFFASLRKDGVELQPVPCGGQDAMDQQREQWFSAANLLPVGPGKVIIYRSSERTIAALAERGYRVVDVNDVRTGAASVSLDDDEKWVLKIKGSELSRGHGGPRSLVLPLLRDS